MSMAIPTRRIASRCLSSSSPFHCYQKRAATNNFFKGGSSNSEGQASDQASSPRSNPILDEYLRKNPPTSATVQQAPQLPKEGDIASSSIFADADATSGSAKPLVRGSAGGDGGLPGRDRATMARFTDPDPNARERWERKKIIQLVRRGGRFTNAQMMKRTEREHLVKSHMLKTSVKKLGMLARQIAGKTLDEAIVQMRFSKKKAAVEMRAQLEAARDEAVVMRGMGLGQVVTPEAAAAAAAAAEGQGDAAPQAEAPIDIQLKNGQRHTVSDRSQIYIDQAWVGRGTYGKLPEYRARGRVNLLRPPWTSFSVLLKEEATRVREWQEREAKRKRQRTGDKVWTAMPDRPIQIQRQWYSW